VAIVANSPAYNKAIAKQQRTIKTLVEAGYDIDYAIKKAKQWHPTPAQDRMRKARNSRKGNKKNGY
jgi:hypothetical protein